MLLLDIKIHTLALKGEDTRPAPPRGKKLPREIFLLNGITVNMKEPLSDIFVYSFTS